MQNPSKNFGFQHDLCEKSWFEIFWWVKTPTKPPNVTISQLCLVGEDGYGNIMKIFNFEVAYTNQTDPNEKIELGIAVLGTFSPIICLIEINSIKSDELFG